MTLLQNVYCCFGLPVLLTAGWFCESNTLSQDPFFVEGATMGTKYHVTYFDPQHRDLKPSIDSLLNLVNRSINTYDPATEVSVFNRSEKGIRLVLPFFHPVLSKALEVAALSGGAFDPTVMPLVNAWGFGPDRSLKPTRVVIDSLRQFVGYQKIVLTNDSVTKSDPRVQLDFGGIGQGYGADVVASFLKAKGITNFLVEIGGEGIAWGKNLKRNSDWTIGILDPNSTPDHQFYKAYVRLNNKSFTTAGNYFNYRVIEGRKYGHTLDPKTGEPVQHKLLSVSVFTHDCTTADAWDTALLAAGFDKAVELLKRNSTLDALLLYSTQSGEIKTYCTPGLTHLIDLEQN
jgi:FAD:protein FMN transferase